MDGLLSSRLAPLALKPKHVSLLSALELGAPGSQAELASTLHVAQSLIVLFVDHLQDLGAVRRERDPSDRRRQQVVLTDEGRRLLAESLHIAEEIDQEITEGMSASERATVLAFLARRVNAIGVPVEIPATEAASGPGD